MLTKSFKFFFILDHLASRCRDRRKTFLRKVYRYVLNQKWDSETISNTS